MTESQILKRAAELKELALKNYALDGGTLYECSDWADYVEAIREHGTANKAWADHLNIFEIQRESVSFDI